MNKKVWLGIMSCVLLVGCSWVKLTPGGEKVRVLDASDVPTCKHLGDSTVSLLSQLAGINRNEEKVQIELKALARNAGAEMGGDTVVPVSAVTDGKQMYAVYKCVGVAAQ
ncbi:MAG: DUF4156 domain-containing protein [Pseudomonadota bacterium]